MSTDKLRLTECVSIALGGMIGGGIFAVQGWQLLYYDQESIADPQFTLRRAVYIAIPAALLLYVVGPSPR